jgi:hypothetical protein
LIIWNVSLMNLPNVLPSLALTLLIATTHRQVPFTTVTFFLNTPCARNRFLLGWERNGHGTTS